MTSTNKEEYGYVKFLGDYSKLKSMGFTFQKLFAGNYMQWEKDKFRVWKKGGDITHDRYDLYKLITFLRTNPIVKPWGDGTNFFFYKFHLTEGREDVYNYYPYTEENRQKYMDWMALFSDENYTEGDDIPYLGDSVSISQATIDYIQEWDDMGWFELAYYPQE